MARVVLDERQEGCNGIPFKVDAVHFLLSESLGLIIAYTPQVKILNMSSRSCLSQQGVFKCGMWQSNLFLWAFQEGIKRKLLVSSIAFQHTDCKLYSRVRTLLRHFPRKGCFSAFILGIPHWASWSSVATACRRISEMFVICC